MNPKLVDIAYLMGSGRLNLEVEQRVMAVVGANNLRDWNRFMRQATPGQIEQTWTIVKATPAGQELAEMGPFERVVESHYNGQASRRASLQRRNASPARQAQGRVASRDYKKASGQRRGQRQSGYRRSRG